MTSSASAFGSIGGIRASEVSGVQQPPRSIPSPPPVGAEPARSLGARRSRRRTRELSRQGQRARSRSREAPRRLPCRRAPLESPSPCRPTRGRAHRVRHLQASAGETAQASARPRAQARPACRLERPEGVRTSALEAPLGNGRPRRAFNGRARRGRSCPARAGARSGNPRTGSRARAGRRSGAVSPPASTPRGGA